MGFVLGVLLGVLLSRKPKLSNIVLPVLSVFNTIPGIVFIGLLVLFWGAQSATVLVALGVYATFPVLKNTYAGLVSVDQQYIEAAKGCGMSPMQSLLQVELPLAMPTIIGGLRMSTVYTVSWAVLASMIGGGGLGDFIYAGISSNDNMLILMGAIPAALLAFVLGSLVDALQRKVVAPWWTCSSAAWSPRGCRGGAVTHDHDHDPRAHVPGGGRPPVRHSGRHPPGHHLLLLPLHPKGDPAGGGPDPDHPRPGPAGHHHGHSGPGQADRHRGPGPLFPAAHRAQHLPGRA